MISGTIGKQTVDIVLNGLAQAQRQLDQFSTQLAKTADKAKQIGTSATAAFSQASTAIMGFARAADPLGSLQLDIAFARLSVQIGRIFIPILREATQWISKVADYLNSLSDDTRESILHWTKLGLAVLGALAGLTKIVGIATTIIGAFGQLWGVITGVAGVLWKLLGFLGPWGRLAVIVGSVVAAFVGLGKAGEETTGIVGKLVSALQAAWQGVQALFGKLWGIVAPALDKLREGFQTASQAVLDALVAVWAKIGPKIMPLVERVSSAVKAVFGALVGKLETLWDGAVAAFQVGVEAVSSYFRRLEPVATAVMGAIGEAVDALGVLFERLEPIVDAVMEAIGDGVNLVIGYFQLWERWLTVIANSVKPIIQAFSDLWDNATSGSSGFANALKSVIALGKEVGSKIGEAWEKLSPTLEKLRTMALSVFGGIKDFAQGLLDPLVAAFNTLRPPLEALMGRLGELGGSLVRLFSAVSDVVGNGLAKAFDGIKSVVGPVIDWLVKRVKEIAEVFEKVFNFLYEPVKRVFNAIQTGFAAVVNFIKNAFYGMIEGITAIINKFIDGINVLVKKLDKISPIDLPEIQRFEAGNRPEDKKPELLEDLPKHNNNPHNIQEHERIKPKTIFNDEQRFHENTFFPGAQKPNEGFFSRMAALLGQGKPDEKKEDKKEDKGSKFTGQILGQARFTGIADAMRQAQQSTVPTREQAIMEEINKKQGTQVALLENINEALQQNPGPPGALV